MDRSGARLGEFELIGRFFAPLRSREGTHPDVILGIGDDAALLHVPPGMDLVAAVDTLVAGRHFPLDSDAHSIGYRTLAVNLSDMAAMGATPKWATLALTLPVADPLWLERFSRGLFELADFHDVALVGGDTTAGPLTISLQVLGLVARDSALRRGGACVGDIVAVTGTLGDAGAGLALVTHAFSTADDDAARWLVRRFEYPSPRVEFGVAARGIATAAMDLSDGLVGDLAKFAAASGLAAHVAVDRLPISTSLNAVVAPSEARAWALAAGDDYELLLAVPPDRLSALLRIAAGLNLTLTAIGEMRTGSGLSWSLHGDKFDAPARGFDHFP